MSTGRIRDIGATDWFSPLQPVNPAAPSTYRPRQWGYPIGANIIWQPKGDSPISYAVLRDLADSWDLLRIIIETQKDRICGVKWDIRHIEEPGETKQDRKQRNLTDPVIKQLKEFFKYPDNFHPFADWLRMWLEDAIVLDAVALYLERDTNGKVANVMPLASDTINRMLTDQGITPPPPSVAYQQVVYGTIAYDFTTDDMLFSMKNERTHKHYGYGPVEQILRTICFGLRRQEWQISEYTSGNVPEALVFLPADLPVERVAEAQDWFDSILAGDLQQRRRIRFLPGYGSGNEAKPNIVFPKEPLLKDVLDEWFAQVACFCIGISAQPFLKMINRATAQTSQEISEEEGLAPWVAFVRRVLNNLIQNKMGFKQYEFVEEQPVELDILKRAQSDKLIAGTIYTINELREQRGEDPRSEPEADKLGVITPQGFIPLGETAMGQQTGESGGGNGNGKPSGTSAGSKAGTSEKMAA